MRDGNPSLDDFEASCFDGRYITGDITPDYLSQLATERNQARGQAEPDAVEDAQARVRVGRDRGTRGHHVRRCHGRGRIGGLERTGVRQPSRYDEQREQRRHAAAERDAILRAGRETAGHLGHTAERLGISRATLWRKMKLYGLTREHFWRPPINS